jgi:ATP-binding cassette subfamily B protein
VRGRLAFEKVSFRYGGEDAENVLDGIDLIIEPGQTVAFLGATGSGKSTLVNLVPRFYDPTAGRILLDGIDLRSVKQESLLAEIAVVPQETVLFSGTVRENIRLRRTRSRRKTRSSRRLGAAQAHDFITALSKGYDTHVEERGTNLSGGQKQRIAMARALLMRPRILILDDSTSAVDVETETRIQEALASKRDRTTLVVAQRISTVLRADRIVVLEGGRITAQGSHAELMAVSSIYREIFDSQLGNDFSTAPLNDGGGAPPVERGAP